MDDHPMQIIGRVRRAMPRNEDVMTICNLLEERLVSANAQRHLSKLTRAQIQKNYRLRKKAAKK